MRENTPVPELQQNVDKVFRLQPTQNRDAVASENISKIRMLKFNTHCCCVLSFGKINI